MSEWQPIETAPMDGTHVMLFCPQGDGSPGSTFRVTCGFWDEDAGGITEHRDLQGRYLGQEESEGWAWWCTLDGGFSEETMMPTHWMPLPPPPQSIRKREGEMSERTMTTKAAMAFLNDMAVFFERRPTYGEDAAHWSNVTNAENCRIVARMVHSIDVATAALSPQRTAP